MRSGSFAKRVVAFVKFSPLELTEDFGEYPVNSLGCREVRVEPFTFDMCVSDLFCFINTCVVARVVAMFFGEASFDSCDAFVLFLPALGVQGFTERSAR